jgi:hypothetical protein
MMSIASGSVLSDELGANAAPATLLVVMDAVTTLNVSAHATHRDATPIES